MNTQRLIDYYFNLDDPEQRQETANLLATDSELNEIYQGLSRSLSPMKTWEEEQPPAGLADKTLATIKEHQQARVLANASAAMANTPDTLSPIKSNTERARWILGNLRDLIAVAAAVMLIMMVSRPGVHYARGISDRYQCASQMKSVGQAVSQYAQHNNGKYPLAQYQPGQRWWASNQNEAVQTPTTQSIVLLIKNGAPAGIFICPSKRPTTQPVSPNHQPAKHYINPALVNYSPRLVSNGYDTSAAGRSTEVLFADKNPLFANYRTGNPDHESYLQITAHLKKLNSPNHNGTGQHVLFKDNRVEFFKTRFIGIGQDDIYTIRNTEHYRGTELPSSGDIFTAP